MCTYYIVISSVRRGHPLHVLFSGWRAEKALEDGEVEGFRLTSVDGVWSSWLGLGTHGWCSGLVSFFAVYTMECNLSLGSDTRLRIYRLVLNAMRVSSIGL